MSIDIAKLIAQNFKALGKPVGVRALTLTKPTPGTRLPGAASSGTNPISISYSAQGIVIDYKAYQIDGTIILAGDRQVLVFGASIAGGAVPAPNDQVTIAGETLTITKNGVTRDPVGATYQCNCRK